MNPYDIAYWETVLFYFTHGSALMVAGAALALIAFTFYWLFTVTTDIWDDIRFYMVKRRAEKEEEKFLKETHKFTKYEDM